MTKLDPMAGSEQTTVLPPSSDISNPTAFVAPAIVQSHHTLEVKRMMAQVAEKLAHNPLAMQQFCDRIHQLLYNDMKLQQERSCRR